MSDKSMFNKLMDAIMSIGEYCTGSKQSDRYLKHFYKTEFYNEGWMLKLLLARLLEMKDENIAGDLKHIREAATKGWMSEGRLSPAFTNEQCTHADAVLGDIEINDATKWGVKLKANPEYFTVIEAKLGSTLSRGVKHANEFNQAARNLSCMAYVMTKANIDVESRSLEPKFFVVMPEEDRRYTELQDFFKNSGEETKEMAKQEADKAKDKQHHLVDYLDSEQTKKTFKTFIDRVECKLISWREICNQVNHNSLSEFYEQALVANNVH